MNIQNTRQNPSFGYLARVDIKNFKPDGQNINELSEVLSKAIGPTRNEGCFPYPYLDMGGVATAATPAEEKSTLDYVHLPFNDYQEKGVLSCFVICGRHIHDFLKTCGKISDEYRAGYNNGLFPPDIAFVKQSIIKNMSELMESKGEGQVFKVNGKLPLHRQLEVGTRAGELYFKKKTDLITEADLAKQEFPEGTDRERGLRYIGLY